MTVLALAVAICIAAILTARAIARSGIAVAKAIEDSGRSMTEALGGFWQSVNEDPTFIPLDEFISQKFLESGVDDLNMNDLVLEGVSSDGG